MQVRRYTSLCRVPQPPKKEKVMQKKKVLKGLLAVSAVAAMFSTFGVQAQSAGSGSSSGVAPGAPGASGASLSKGDQKALVGMAQANMAEVAAGKLAQSKSQNDQVKSFAQQMIDDHTKALTEVQQV